MHRHGAIFAAFTAFSPGRAVKPSGYTVADVSGAERAAHLDPKSGGH